MQWAADAGEWEIFWKKAAEDSEAQEAMHHKATIEDFIVVEA